MAKRLSNKVREFRFPPELSTIIKKKLTNFRGLKDKQLDNFWSWRVKNIAQKAGLVDIPQFKTISDMVLWLNTAAGVWKAEHPNEIIDGEKQMNIKESIRKLVIRELELINEAKKKSKKEPNTAEFKKTSSATPNIKVTRSEEKDDTFDFNKEYLKAEEELKKSKNTGVPTDAEWKKLRNAEEVKASPSPDEINETWTKLIEKIEDDVEEMCEISTKLDDKTLCDLIKEVKKMHKLLSAENRQRYKFFKIQYTMRPALARLRSLSQLGDASDKESDIEKLKKLLEKYLNVEYKKKFDTETERSEQHEKDINKKKS